MQKFSIAFLAAMSLASFGCKKKGGAGEAMAKMGEFKDQMCACKDKKCADGVQDAMNKWSAENAKNAGDKPEKPDEETMKKMSEVGTKYGECMATAMGGGAAPAGDKPAGDKPAGDKPAGAPPAAGGGDMPAECNDYKAAMEKLATCDKMPAASKDALKQSYDAMSAGWANVAGMPAEAKKAMADGCKQGADALMQTGKSVCGW